MTRKWLRNSLPVLALSALLGQAAMAQVEGPVEQGLAQLAGQIVAKSTAAGKSAIAVLPFPNSDDSCSVLSNFIADELIQSLFSIPGSKLEIVERAQLETIISELKLGASGLLNPETTKKLGSQSGVSALTVGTITVIGDTVRINARLIATDSGKAVSAAAVDIPKVAAVSELLRQPISAGPTCGAQRAESAPGAKPPPSISPPEQNPSPTTLPQERIAGNWEASLGHDVTMSMQIMPDGKWNSETLQGNGMVRRMVGTYTQVPPAGNGPASWSSRPRAYRAATGKR